MIARERNVIARDPDKTSPLIPQSGTDELIHTDQSQTGQRELDLLIKGDHVAITALTRDEALL